jgi:hypothetical protein
MIKKYIPSLSKREQVFHDTFIGNNYDNSNWFGSGTGSLSVVATVSGMLMVRANSSSAYILYANDRLSWSQSDLIWEWRAKAVTLASSTIEIGVRGIISGNDYAWFQMISSQWQVKTSNAVGSNTSANLVAANTNYHTFKGVHTNGYIYFFYDNALVASYNTNLPTTMLQPYMRIVSGTTATRDIYVNYCHFVGGRAQ